MKSKGRTISSRWDRRRLFPVFLFFGEAAHAFSSRAAKGQQQQQIPQANPTANAQATSSHSGVGYANVLTGLDRLYPPVQLEVRHAASRKDGYWPYIHQGKEPPEQFTYGEFDFYFFAQLLDKAYTMYHSQMEAHDYEATIFCDIGSGAGRLVVAAAALHPTWQTCRGIELLPSMHELAEDIVTRNCRREKEIMGVVDELVDPVSEQVAQEFAEEPAVVTEPEEEQFSGNKPNVSFRLPLNNQQSLPMAPIELVCGSFTDPYTYFGDANVIFMFSSALSPELLTELSMAIGRQCQPGTIVITTDYALDLTGTVPAVPGDDRLAHEGTFQFELVETMDGWCWCTGGETTAYIHRVIKSVGMPEPLERRILTLQDICFDVAMKMERGELSDRKMFLLGVANNARFHGLPEAFVPRSYRE